MLMRNPKQERKTTNNIVNDMIDSNIIDFSLDKLYLSDNDNLEEFSTRYRYVNNVLKDLRNSATIFPNYEGLIIGSDASFLWKNNHNVKQDICIGALTTSDGNVISANMRAEENNITDNNYAEYYSLLSALKYALECTDDEQNNILLTTDSEYAINHVLREYSSLILNNDKDKNIEILQVRGHGHDYLNTVSDRLAKYHADNILIVQNSPSSKNTARQRVKRMRQGLRREVSRVAQNSKNSNVNFYYNL